jgi:hypothetical protein
MKEFVSFQWRTFGPPPGLCPGPTGGLQGSPQTSCLLMRPVQKILDPPLWFLHVSIRQVPLQYSQSKTHHFMVVVVEGFHFICHFLFVYVFPLTLSNFIYSRGILKVDSPFDQYWTPPSPLWKQKVDSPPPFENQTQWHRTPPLKNTGIRHCF